MAQSFSKFTDLEEHFMLGLMFNDIINASTVEQDVKEEIWSVATTSWSQEQKHEGEEFWYILHRVWEWRKYQVCRLGFTDETTDNYYPTAPPEVNFKDVKKLGFNEIRTFAIGMYAIWLISEPVKLDDEDDDVFAGRVHLHDREFGYVCKEALDKPMFHRDNVIEELDRQKQTILNSKDHVGRSRSR